jgi:hypothetical protein
LITISSLPFFFSHSFWPPPTYTNDPYPHFH